MIERFEGNDGKRRLGERSMKIVVLDGYALNPGDLSWEALEQLGDCTVYDRTAPDETIPRAADAEILLTNKTVLSAETLSQLGDCIYIGVLATGYNVVDTGDECDDGPNKFCPDDRMRREDLAAFMVRALDLPATSTDYFHDDDGLPFEDDINSLAEARITLGCNPPTNNEFCPDSTVTRGQTAAFIVRAWGLADAGAGDRFIDDDRSVFEGDIDRLAFAGITKGCNPPDNTRYCPDRLLTRAEMSSFLARALQNL